MCFHWIGPICYDVRQYETKCLFIVDEYDTKMLIIIRHPATQSIFDVRSIDIFYYEITVFILLSRDLTCAFYKQFEMMMILTLNVHVLQRTRGVLFREFIENITLVHL